MAEDKNKNLHLVDEAENITNNSVEDLPEPPEDSELREIYDDYVNGTIDIEILTPTEFVHKINAVDNSKDEDVLNSEAYTELETSQERQEYIQQANQEEIEDIFMSIMTRTYVPVIEKKLILQQMFDKSVGTMSNGVMYVDRFLYEFNLKMALVILYTNLDVNHDVGDDGMDSTIYEIYDELNQAGLFEAIMNTLDESELNEFQMIARCIEETWVSQNKNMDSVLRDAINSVENAVKAVVPMIGDFGDMLMEAAEEQEKEAAKKSTAKKKTTKTTKAKATKKTASKDSEENTSKDKDSKENKEKSKKEKEEITASSEK